MEIVSLVERPLEVGAAVISLSLLGYLSARAVYRKQIYSTDSSSQYPLPPGPPSNFLIGSARYFPSSNLWGSFCKWQNSFGDIVYARLPGTSFVMINSQEVCQKVLSKQTNKTSGRDAGYMFTTVMKLGWLLSMIQPGIRHTNQRRMIRKAIGPAAIGSHDPHLEQIGNDLALQLAEFQGYVPNLVQNVMSRVIVEITYGREIWKRAGEELATNNHELMHLSEIGLFNFWSVNFLHFLRYIPSWVPGATFKRVGERTAWLSDFVRYRPFEMATELHGLGRIDHCMASELLDEFGPDEDVRDALGMLYQAGSDTTSGAISAFLHNMFLFPDVADRIFLEIRHVTQGKRLLQIADRSSLPFTEAVWKESLRWNPFFTLGVPHVNNEDVVVNGVRIPKGSVIGQNIGFMLIDPKVWGDPEVFRPERFLDSDAGSSIPNPNFMFGFGARACPGMYLADKAGFHFAVMTVSLFNIMPLEGKQRPDPANAQYTDMPLRSPKDFYARFTPRDQQAEYLLKTLSLEA
ncbi:hypothetical protein FRC19_011599 [Serendipita sp. 401]|nr:hypothetical protein FRC19_011599 [Serendipita sp. 401]